MVQHYLSKTHYHFAAPCYAKATLSRLSNIENSSLKTIIKLKLRESTVSSHMPQAPIIKPTHLRFASAQKNSDPPT